MKLTNMPDALHVPTATTETSPQNEETHVSTSPSFSHEELKIETNVDANSPAQPEELDVSTYASTAGEPYIHIYDTCEFNIWLQKIKELLYRYLKPQGIPNLALVEEQRNGRRSWARQYSRQ